MTRRSKDFHGFNFCLLSRKEKHSNTLCYSAGLEESVSSSIFTILSTAPGERPLNPSFGCALHRFVFARIDESILNDLASEVRSSLVRCEPRLTVQDVTVKSDLAEPTRLEIHIQYRIRQNGICQSLVFPMSLIE